MAAAPKVTLVTIAVSGPGQVSGYKDNRWAWEVDGPGGMLDGHESTEGEAWAVARAAAVKVMGRLGVRLGRWQTVAVLIMTAALIGAR